MKLPKEAYVQLETMNSIILEMKELKYVLLTEIVNDYRQFESGFVFLDGDKRYQVGEATIVQSEICYWCSCIRLSGASASLEGAPYLESTIEQLLQGRRQESAS